MKKPISISVLSILLVFSVNIIATAQEYVPNEVLIKFHRGVGKQSKQVAINSVQGKIIGTFRLDSDLLHLKVPETVGADVAISNLVRNPNVKYAVRNHIYYITQDQVFPDDKRFGQQWALHNSRTGADIDAPEAWGIFKGSREIIVAVLDTGVDYNHQDLASNIWINEAEKYGYAGEDDDENGYIDDIYGYNFVYENSDPIDDHGHGTKCAGVIGAVGNNGLGITGINWTVRIMCLKIHNAAGISTAADVIEATHYAIANGAHITSNSYGNRGDKGSPGVKEALNTAHDKGILCVFACGNDSVNVDLDPFYPACFDNDNIISVTAANKNNDQLYNWGQTTVDMAGFSPQITTTEPGNRYTVLFGGTSAACPHVAGVAALVWGYDPDLTHMDVKNRLMDTVRLVPSLMGKCVTEGTVNAYNALSGGDPPPPPPEAPSNLTANVSACEQIDLSWQDNSNNEDGFKIERSEDGANFDQIDSVGSNVTTYSDTGLAENTLYWYKVKANNVGGDSDYSNIASDTTPTCPSEPPDAPTDLSAKARGKDKVALKWKDNSNNEDRFIIYRGLAVTSLSYITDVGPNITSYVDTGLTSTTTYYYMVCAHNAYGDSCSNTAEVGTK